MQELPDNEHMMQFLANVQPVDDACQDIEIWEFEMFDQYANKENHFNEGLTAGKVVLE